MPTPHVTAGDSGYGLIADALYEYCRENHDPDDILLQELLLKPDIVPDKDLEILLLVCQHLVDSRLFKVHELKGGGIGWRLITRERAENYNNLSTDESLVYGIIDSNGSKGIWTKNIKNRLNIHAKIVERAFKSLESKGLIEPMKDVKFPSRKMFIRKGLKPSDEATGGSWYTDGVLDAEMIDLVATVIEKIVGDKSWIEIKEAPPAPPSPGEKRKGAQAGLDDLPKGKEKLAKISVGDDNHKSKSRPQPQPVKSYIPQPPDYPNFPTLPEITNAINTGGYLQRGLLPQNAVDQLLQVMVYDDKLIKFTTTADLNTPSKTMYRTVKNPNQIAVAQRLSRRLMSEDENIRKKALREQELEIIGAGGSTEIPCTRCPVFDFCEEGGPVNPVSCTYWDEWFQKLDF